MTRISDRHSSVSYRHTRYVKAQERRGYALSYSIVWWMQTAQASHSGEAQHHRQGRCAAISNPTLERLRLDSIVSYSIVWWIQAAQASYSGKAQHHKQGRYATRSTPILDRLRLHIIVSYRIVWWRQAAQAY